MMSIWEIPQLSTFTEGAGGQSSSRTRSISRWSYSPGTCTSGNQQSIMKLDAEDTKLVKQKPGEEVMGIEHTLLIQDLTH